MADGKVTISTALDNSGMEKDAAKVEQSAKKTAMALAAEYRKAGMSQSEALKKAWSEIERTTTKSSKKSGNAIRKNMGGAAQSVVGSLGGLNTVIGKLMGAIAGAFSVYQIGRFGAACIELGSDVAEVQNVVDVSFGSMAYKMEEFADTAITSFGMSKLAAKQAGSTYMAMARGMGVAEDAASDMAIALTGLSGDVASFFNISQEDAAYKLRSIFTGETETLKDLGVVMTQANLQQYAMAHGMNSNIQAMSQAEQVALRYSFVVDSLKLAAGDFARTQDSWANQTRILAMQWQEFMSVIGQALTTVLLPLVKLLNIIVAALINMANTLNSVITAIFGGSNTQLQGAGAMADANAAIASSAADAAAGEDALADAAAAAGKAAKGATLGIDELNVVQQNTGTGGGSGGTSAGAGTAGGALQTTVTGEAAGLSDGLQKIVDKIQQLWQPIRDISFDNLIRAFDSLKQALEPIGKGLFDGLEWAWYNLLVPLATWTIQDALPVFLEGLAAALNLLSAVVQALQPGAQWLWDNFLQPLAAWTGDAIVKALELVRDGLQGVSDWIAEHSETIQTAIVWIGSFAASWGLVTGALTVWNTAVGIWNNVGKIAATVVTNFGKVIGLLTSPITLVILAIGALVALIATKGDEIQAILQEVDDYLQNIFAINWTKIFGPVLGGVLNGFLASVKSIWDSVKRIFDGIIDFIRGVFTGDWERAWKGVQDIFGGIFDGLVAMAKAPLNLIIGLLNGVVGAVNSMIGGLNQLRFEAPDWVPVIGGKSWGVHIPTLPSLPYLAQGAVIPPNREFLAVLGDQRSGTNIEAPLSTIQQAVAAELASSPQLAYLQQMIELLQALVEKDESIYIGDEEIYRAAGRGSRKAGYPVGLNPAFR